MFYYGVFKSVVAITFQSVFCSKIYQDNVFSMSFKSKKNSKEFLFIYYVKDTTMKILKNHGKATNEIHKSKCTKTKGLVDCLVESLKGNFPRGQ